MTLPLCLEPISRLAFDHGWKLDLIPEGQCLDQTDGQARTIYATHTGNSAVIFRRYHTEAYDHVAAELSASVREALREQNQKDERQRKIAKRAGERRSWKQKRD